MTSARLKVAGMAFTAILAAVGLAAVAGGLGYGAFGDKGLIGPGFLPILAGGLVALFAVIDIVARLRDKPEHSVAELALDQDSIETLEDAAIEVEPEVDLLGRTQKQRNRMLIAVIGIAIVTLLLVNVIGFILAFGLMLIACAVFVERRKLVPSIIVSAVALGTAYLIFGVLLRVPLPQGLFGIF